MPNWGAFAGGLSEGIETGQKMVLQKRAADREQQEFDQKQKDWDRQNQMHAALDAAGNTVAPDADPTKFLSREDYDKQFAAPAKKGALRDFIDRNFGGDEKPAPTDAAPVKTGAFAAADGTAPAPKSDAPKKPSKDDYAPVSMADGSIQYVPRANVKKQEGGDLYESVASAIAPFDPVAGMNMRKGAQELKSGAYKLKSQEMEEGILSAGRLWTTDPQGALDKLAALHTSMPDGQQVKMTYDPKTGKIQSQFFAETKKGLMPMGKPQIGTFDQVWEQATSLATPEGYKAHLERALQQAHNTAIELNAKAQLANSNAHLALAQKADVRAQTAADARNAYLNTRTKALQDQVGGDWKVAARTNPETQETEFVRTPKNGKGGDKPQVFSKTWGGWVQPQFDGPEKRQMIEEGAHAKGVVAKMGKDGQVYYINPKTNLMSTNINEAVGGKPTSGNGPQVPFNPQD